MEKDILAGEVLRTLHVARLGEIDLCMHDPGRYMYSYHITYSYTVGDIDWALVHFLYHTL